MEQTSRRIMDAQAMARTLRRIASEIVERNQGTDNLCLVGIWTRGVALAKRLTALIEEKEGVAVPMGTMDITLYRDDAASTLPDPQVGPTKLEFGIRGKTVVLVDDVLYTGRTVRAAMDELMDFGRPKKVELAVLVDRGWRELPIQADYVGITIKTEAEDRISVRVEEEDGTDEVMARTSQDGR